MPERHRGENAGWLSQFWRLAQIVLVLALGAFIVVLLVSGFIIRDRDVESFENVEKRYYYGFMEQIDYTVTAPASGTVRDLQISEGTTVEKDQVLARLITDEARQQEERADGEGGDGEQAQTGEQSSAPAQAGGRQEQAETDSRSAIEREAAKYSESELRELIIERQFEVRDAELEIDKLESRLEERRSELESLERLLEKGAATEAEVREARAAVRETEFDLEQARVRLERRQRELDRFNRLLRVKRGKPARRGVRMPDGSYRVHAPHPGEVVSMEVSQGDYITRGHDMFSFTRTDRYRLSFQSHERLARYFNPASEVTIQVMGEDDSVQREVELEIDEINRHWMTFLVSSDTLSPAPNRRYRIDLAQY